MEHATRNTHARAETARRRAHSFSLIFDEIFTEDMVPACPAASAAAAALGSSAFGLPANGHGPNTDAAASAELSGFNGASGGALFPENFCIGENGEDLIYSVGPERAPRVAQGEVSFENFSMDGGNDGDFIVKLVNFEENTKAKYDVLDTPPPSFDFASITSKLEENDDSWRSLETKAKHLVAAKKGRSVKATKKKVKMPTTNKRKVAPLSEDSGMSKEARRREAAESHRRATAKRSRTQGRFAKRQYVWVNVDEDGRKTADKE